MPKKLKSLDPAWVSCQSDYYEGVDPPHALTAAAAMDPAITAAGPPPTQTPAIPSSAPKVPPVNTGSEVIPDPSPVKDSSSSTASGLQSHASPAPIPSVSDRGGVIAASSVAEGGPPASKGLESSPSPNGDPKLESKPAEGVPPASKGVESPSPPDGDPKLGSKPAAGDPASSNGPVAVPGSASSGFHIEIPVATSTADPAANSPSTSNVSHPEVSVASVQISSAPQTEQHAVSTLVVAGTTPAPAVMVQGHTLAENSPPVPIGGSTVGFTSGYIYVGSNVTPAPTHAPQQSSGTVFQGLTFSPLPFNGADTAAPPIATVDGKIITPLGSSRELAIEGTTIKPGDASITVARTLISVGAGVVAIGSTTITLPTPLHIPIFTIADHPFTANPTGFSIFDTTLRPGSPGVTIAGTQLSLAPSGVLVIGSSTVQLRPLPPTPPPITLASQTITANSLSQYMIDSQTHVPGGPAITVNGTPISLPATSSDVVIRSSTEVLATTAGGRIGGVILSGLGPIGPGEPTAATAANANYTGPMFGSSTGCVAYRWSWPRLGLSLFLGLSSVMWL